MSLNPRVFIGSSSEADHIDRQVRKCLESLGADVIGWRDIFRPGDYPLEVLLNLGTSVDGALLIATPDDLTNYRGGERMSPRDNVLLELGMFLSHFGKRRTGIVHVQSSKGVAALPTDLHGVTTLSYNSEKTSQNEYQLQLWLDGVKSEMENQHPALPQVFEALRKTFREVSSSWHAEVEKYIVRPFVSSLHLAAQGEVVLTPNQYYLQVFEEVDRAAAPGRILGVATLASTFWTDDRDQRRYISKNVAAIRRGVDIRRLFIVPDREWPQLFPVIKRQLEVGISIRRARRSALAGDAALEDMVMFIDGEDGSSRAYIADHYFDNTSRIRRARLLMNAEDRGDLLDAFERVWARASVVTMRDLQAKSADADRVTPEPGSHMKEYMLASPVVTCEEASAAKGIPLKEELKTLLLSTQRGYVALHLPGDAEACLRSVKNALEVRDACLASPEDLLSLGLQAGTVCAVRDPIWSMPHLISSRVFESDMVSTNNGTHRGFYRFHPSVLLEAETVTLGNFERCDSTSGGR